MKHIIVFVGLLLLALWLFLQLLRIVKSIIEAFTGTFSKNVTTAYYLILVGFMLFKVITSIPELWDVINRMV